MHAPMSLWMPHVPVWGSDRQGGPHALAGRLAGWRRGTLNPWNEYCHELHTWVHGRRALLYSMYCAPCRTAPYARLCPPTRWPPLSTAFVGGPVLLRNIRCSLLNVQISLIMCIQAPLLYPSSGKLALLTNVTRLQHRPLCAATFVGALCKPK